MKKFFFLSDGLVLLSLLTPELRAQEGCGEDVAQIDPQHKVKEIEKAIKILQEKVQAPSTKKPSSCRQPGLMFQPDPHCQNST